MKSFRYQGHEDWRRTYYKTPVADFIYGPVACERWNARDGFYSTPAPDDESLRACMAKDGDSLMVMRDYKKGIQHWWELAMFYSVFLSGPLFLLALLRLFKSESYHRTAVFSGLCLLSEAIHFLLLMASVGV